GLAPLEAMSVPLRFQALQTNILAMRMKRFGYEERTASRDFFERQQRFQQHLADSLEERYAVDGAEQVEKRIARVMRTIRSERSALEGDSSPAAALKRPELSEDLEKADEAKRLGEFSRDIYGTVTLSQEQLFESLKRTRDRLLRRGWKNLLAISLPRPFGPR